MRAYKVFLIFKVGGDDNQCALFIETDPDGSKGTILEVAGGTQRGGMYMRRRSEIVLDATWDDDDKDHIGWVLEAKLALVWGVVCRVLPPGHWGARCRTAREWTEQVTRALQTRGVMSFERGMEPTVHQDTDTDTDTDTDSEFGEVSDGEVSDGIILYIG